MSGKFLLYGFLITFSFLFSYSAQANIGGDNKTEIVSKTEILGMVYHSESRKPLRDVVVTAYSASTKKESRAITDNQGNYSFSDLKPGTYRLVFERDGYRKVSRDKVMIKTDDGYQLDIGMDEMNDFEWVPGTFKFSGGED